MTPDEMTTTLAELGWEVCVVERGHDDRCHGEEATCARLCPVPIQRWLSTTEAAAVLAATVTEAQAGALRDLFDRLAAANEALQRLAEGCGVLDDRRLHKAEGVRLAASYVEEMLRPLRADSLVDRAERGQG